MADDVGRLLSSIERQVCGPVKFGKCFLINAPAEILEQDSMVRLQNRHAVQGNTSQTSCLECFPHQRGCHPLMGSVVFFREDEYLGER